MFVAKRPEYGVGTNMITQRKVDDLVAINLRFDAGAEALNIRALAQLVAKLLFAGGKAVSKRATDLGKEGGKVLGVPRMGEDSVLRALRFLQGQRIARESAGRWLLTDRGYQDIETDVTRAGTRLRGLLARHFPARLEETKLNTWFHSACVAFYGLYGTQWAAALGKQTTRKAITPTTVAALLRNATAQSGLRADTEVLSDGFHSFLNSQHTEDIEHQWSLGQSLLAARLVAANIGPDPITTEDFRNSILLLDTNTLIVAALEAHRLAKPLEQLGQALCQLGVQLARIGETRDEYIRVVYSKRQGVLKIVGSYPISVLKESGDPFIITGLERYCASEADFEVFFNGLMDPPESFADGSPIKTLGEQEVLDLARKGAADEKLKREINAVWQSLRPWPKGVKATEHDAALTAVAEGLHAVGQRCAVLTLDRTMQEHALQRAGQNAPPLWVSLDALIQVLAVEGSGPALDPSGFAPLMASIIRHQCEPVLHTYTAEDLGLILDVEERCAKLPDHEVRRIAGLVARGRLAGKRKDDPELQLQVRRAFQTGRLGYQDELKEELRISGATIRIRDQQIENEVRGRSVARDAFIRTRTRELNRNARKTLVLQCAGAVAAATILAAAAYEATTGLAAPGRTAEFIGLLFTFLGPAAGAFAWIWRSALPRWKASVDSAATQAEAELDVQEDVSLSLAVDR